MPGLGGPFALVGLCIICTHLVLVLVEQNNTQDYSYYSDDDFYFCFHFCCFRLMLFTIIHCISIFINSIYVIK